MTDTCAHRYEVWLEVGREGEWVVTRDVAICVLCGHEMGVRASARATPKAAPDRPSHGTRFYLAGPPSPVTPVPEGWDDTSKARAVQYVSPPLGSLREALAHWRSETEGTRSPGDEALLDLLTALIARIEP